MPYHTKCNFVRKSCSDSYLSFFKLGTGDKVGIFKVNKQVEPNTESLQVSLICCQLSNSNDNIP